MKPALIGTALVALMVAGCGEKASQPQGGVAADTVFEQGRIYTEDSAKPWAEALAIKDGKIIAVGTNDEMKSYIGATTERIDLGGRFAMSGIYDAHSHMYGGLKELNYCLFPAEFGPDQIKARLEECVAKAKDDEFVIGGYWVSSFFDTNNIASPREWLDAISSERPIILSDDSGHNSWVNTKALEVLGWSKDTPDPEGGRILRGADGTPNGVLYETAAQNADAFFEERFTWDQQKAGLKHTLELAAGFGLTGIKDASLRPMLLEVLYEMDTKEGGLTAYVAASQYTPYGPRTEPLDYDYYSQRAVKYRSTNLDPRFIKLFLDGVPTSSRSAAMTTDYTADPAHPEAPVTKGDLHLCCDLLNNDVAELDKRGFTIKIHAAGDRAAETSLDAFAFARQQNGDSGLLHEVAHAGFIRDEDLSRFVSLHVAPDISPYLWFPSPIIDNIKSAVGDEVGDHYWPNRTLYDLGATIVAGSDWPSVSPTINPWYGIEATVTRMNPDGLAKGVYWPEQKLTLEETLKIFTLNGAKALRIDDVAGSLEKGKLANIIVLDRDLFKIDPSDIGETKILQTWYRGKQVYKAE